MYEFPFVLLRSLGFEVLIDCTDTDSNLHEFVYVHHHIRIYTVKTEVCVSYQKCYDQPVYTEHSICQYDIHTTIS